MYLKKLPPFLFIGINLKTFIAEHLIFIILYQ
jgi:hypothetical protein